MKTTLLLFVNVLFTSILFSQMNANIKGTIKDVETSEPLPFVTVAVFNNNDSLINSAITDFDGNYNLNLAPGSYTLEFKYVDYESKKIEQVIVTNAKTTFLDVGLKYRATKEIEEVMVVSYCMAPSRKMKNTKPVGPLYESNTESYDSLPENPFIATDQKPFSTFSVDVDKAGYSNVRRFLNNGELPPVEAVRIEEMINYFPYDYRSDNENDPLTVSSVYTECPWNKEHRLLHVGIEAREEDFSSAPPNSLVFLIDVSGSMQSPDKLDLLKAGLYELTNQLRPQDQVAIVTYAGATGLVLPTTSGANKTAIRDVLESLDAGGSTGGSYGITQAYEVATQQFIQGGNNRIILATDGDFNLGVTDNDELVKLIEEERKSGVYLSVLGFGQGNLQDNRMEKLADNGNGSYSYIDDLLEAKKVLVDEIGGSLVMVAKDVKLQVQFNPQLVKGYRLIGYENRVLDDADFENDGKDAGDMGSGQTVTALYEIIPAGSNETIAALPTGATGTRAPKKADRALGVEEVASVDIRYKAPSGSVSKLMRSGVSSELIPFSTCSAETKFVAAVAEFGLLLRKSEYKGDASIEQVLEMAKAGLGKDTGGYRKAFEDLVESASGIIH